MPTPLILDLDTGVDDMVALLAGVGGVEIARGASEPLGGDRQPFPVVHGPAERA